MVIFHCYVSSPEGNCHVEASSNYVLLLVYGNHEEINPLNQKHSRQTKNIAYIWLLKKMFVIAEGKSTGHNKPTETMMETNLLHHPGFLFLHSFSMDWLKGTCSLETMVVTPNFECFLQIFPISGKFFWSFVVLELSS